MSKFSFGFNPEFFIIQENEILSNKKQIKKIKGHSFFCDNISAKITIKSGDNPYEVLDNIQESINLLADLIHPNKFMLKSIINLQKNNLNYEKFANSSIKLTSKLFSNPLNVLNIIRMMDLFIGIPSLFLNKTSYFEKVVPNPQIFLFSKNQLEYYLLGNFWFSSPEYVEIIYNLCDFVLHFVENKGHEKFWTPFKKTYICNGYDVNLLQKCINSCDKHQAEKFMMIVENCLPEGLFKQIKKLSEREYLPNPYVEWKINNAIQFS